MNVNEVVVYRGPLERSRLKLLLGSILHKNASQIYFLWIFPGLLSEAKKDHFDKFISAFPFIGITIIPDRVWKLVFTWIRIKLLCPGNYRRAHFIGFSSWFFNTAISSKSKVWYVNGIPEERLMQGKSLSNRISCWMSWFLNKLFSAPDLIVTVSRPMSALIRKRLYWNSSYLNIPLTVDLEVFTRGSAARRYLTYLGTGAPWQNLDELVTVWRCLSKINPAWKFRVISRDKRTRVLGDGINPDSIYFVGAEDFVTVAHYLHEALVGFILRKKDIVNRVSFPTKFGEYLASGARVVITDVGWDLTGYIKRFGCGVVIPCNSSPEAAAHKIAEYLSIPVDESMLQALTDQLSNSRWTDTLSKALNNIHDK